MSKKTVSLAVTFVVIVMLFFSGLSSAVMMEVNSDGIDGIKVGETGLYWVNVTIGVNERVPLDSINISGLPNGDLNITNFTSGERDGYAVEVFKDGWIGGQGGYGYGYNELDSPYLGYGFSYFYPGYGYGYGSTEETTQFTKLNIKVTVNTVGATPGHYNVMNIMYGDGQVIQSTEAEFTLNAPVIYRRSGGGGGGGSYPPGKDTETNVTPTPVNVTPTNVTPTPEPTFDIEETVDETINETEIDVVEEDREGFWYFLPGFTAIFAIAVVLGLVYMIGRRKR